MTLKEILGSVDYYKGGRYEEITEAFRRMFEHFEQRIASTQAAPPAAQPSPAIDSPVLSNELQESQAEVYKLRHANKEHMNTIQHMLSREKQTRRELTMHEDKAAGDYWFWQGKDDHLESLSCPVLIHPEDLLKLISPPTKEPPCPNPNPPTESP